MKALKPKKYFKSIISIEVLSEHNPVDDSSLGMIKSEIFYQVHAGEIKTVQKEVSAKQAVKILKRLGHEPAYFELDSKGRRTDTWKK